MFRISSFAIAAGTSTKCILRPTFLSACMKSFMAVSPSPMIRLGVSSIISAKALLKSTISEN